MKLTSSAVLLVMVSFAFSGASCATAGDEVAAPADPAAYAKPGFAVYLEQGDLWVFRAGSAEAAAFEETGAPAKHIVRPGVGPYGVTVKAPDVETCLAYLASAEGFAVHVVEGRLWVFREGSPALESYLAHGTPANYEERAGAGPGRTTVRGPDAATIDAYVRALAL